MIKTKSFSFNSNNNSLSLTFNLLSSMLIVSWVQFSFFFSLIKLKETPPITKNAVANKANPAITILKLIVLQFVAGIVFCASLITIIGPIIVGVYAGYIASEIQAQYVRGAFKIVQSEQ